MIDWTELFGRMMVKAVGVSNTVLVNNTPPTNILLSNDQVPENEPIGTKIGDLSVVDANLDPATFYILSDPDGVFQLGGSYNSELRVGALMDYETKTSHDVTIRAVSVVSSSHYVDKQFTIQVLDVAEGPSYWDGVSSTLEDLFLVQHGMDSSITPVFDNVRIAVFNAGKYEFPAGSSTWVRYDFPPHTYATLGAGPTTTPLWFSCNRNIVSSSGLAIQMAVLAPGDVQSVINVSTGDPRAVDYGLVGTGPAAGEYVWSVDLTGLKLYWFLASYGLGPAGTISIKLWDGDPR